jgi:hypothetical protein
MRAVSIVIRFVQLLATIPVGLGLSNAGSFFELLNGLAQGQPWDFAEFAKRLAAFSSPTGLGVALKLGLELLLRHGEMAHARALRFPEKPWLWKRMWAERRIRLSNRTPVAICLAALAIFAFVIVPVGLWMKSRMPDAPIYIGLERCPSDPKTCWPEPDSRRPAGETILRCTRPPPFRGWPSTCSTTNDGNTTIFLSRRRTTPN